MLGSKPSGSVEAGGGGGVPRKHHSLPASSEDARGRPRLHLYISTVSRGGQTASTSSGIAGLAKRQAGSKPLGVILARSRFDVILSRNRCDAILARSRADAAFARLRFDLYVGHKLPAIQARSRFAVSALIQARSRFAVSALHGRWRGPREGDPPTRRGVREGSTPRRHGPVTPPRRRR